MQLPSPLGQNPSLPLPTSAPTTVYPGGSGGGESEIYSCINGTIAAGVTSFSGPGLSFLGVEAGRQAPVPRDRTFTTLLVVTNGAQPVGQSLTLALRRSGVDTGIIIVIPGGAGAGTFSAVGSEAFTAGQLVGIRGTQQAGASPSANMVGWSLV